jgi:hypothetical protein
MLLDTLEVSVDEEKWMIFIGHLWGTVYYWELYRTHELPGAFFSLTALAARNELLMRIAHAVHLCQEVAKEQDVGDEAKAALDEMLTLFERGDTLDRSVLTFEDCGVKPYRDKVLAHPLNNIKRLLGKDTYQISLKWATVEQTMNKIKQFADHVEQHNSSSGKSSWSTYKEDTGEMQRAFRAVTRALEDAAEYDLLKRQLIQKGGKATITLDRENHKIRLD